MKKILSVLCVATLLFASCSDGYDDSALTGRVDNLENRVAKLEELCKQMNTNISSLQTIVTALQKNDYVTSVTPVMQNGKEVGYTIAFSKSNPITIYHGKDGQNGADGEDGKPGVDGEDGKNGHTPVIGVKQDTDGSYYWTLDGDWLTDDSGNKIKAEGTDGQPGTPGDDGTPGQDGKPGTDGITPKLKIENGYWYVSYDKGYQTWEQLGKATSEDGAGDIPGQDIFRDVTQDEYNAYFILANGETITLPKKPSLAISFTEGNSLAFQVDETKTVHYTITSGSAKNVIKAEMLNDDGSYILRTVYSSATTGTIEISAKIPTSNRVIVSVSDGSHTIMATIDVVSIVPPFDNNTITVAEPGTLSKLLAIYDKTSIKELTVVGFLNDTDIGVLNELPNLTILNMGEVNLKELPKRAFANKKSLTSIILPKTLQIIGSSAFEYCSGLTGDLTIPSSVTTIGHDAFHKCSGFSGTLTIPNSVTTIDYEAFYGCTGFTGDLTIPGSVTTIEGAVFENCGFSGNLLIEEGVQTIQMSAFQSCSGLTGDLTIPSSITTIGAFAFDECRFTTIHCKSTIPPTIASDIFSSSQLSTCILYVPTGCAETYRTALGWRELTFKEIIETEF